MVVDGDHRVGVAVRRVAEARRNLGGDEEGGARRRRRRVDDAGNVLLVVVVKGGVDADGDVLLGHLILGHSVGAQ